jgi:hypothetical protein
MLHQQLLQQQLATEQKQKNPAFNELPMHIMSTLDNMAFGIAQEEQKDSFEIKKRMVENINKLAPADIEYLKSQMEVLIQISVHQNEKITNENVDQSFVSFLIRLFY